MTDTDTITDTDTVTETTVTPATVTPPAIPPATVPQAIGRWRKSSYSGGGGAGNGDCVEIAHLPGERVAVRDSKHPSSVLVFPRRSIAGFGAIDPDGGLSDGR